MPFSRTPWIPVLTARSIRANLLLSAAHFLKPPREGMTGWLKRYVGSAEGRKVSGKRCPR